MAYVGSFKHFSVQLFLHVFCNSTKTSANISDIENADRGRAANNLHVPARHAWPDLPNRLCLWYRQCRQRRQWPTCICPNLPRPTQLILQLRCGSFAILVIFLPFHTGLSLWMHYLIFFSLLLFSFLQQYFTSQSVLHADGVLFETVEPINQSMCNPIPSLPLAPFSTLCFEFFSRCPWSLYLYPTP